MKDHSSRFVLGALAFLALAGCLAPDQPNGSGTHPSVSVSSGPVVAYPYYEASGRWALEIVSLETGRSSTVHRYSKALGALGWDSDASRFLLTDGHHLYAASVEGQSSERLVNPSVQTPSKSTLERLSARDGRLVFLDDGMNLWDVPIDGDKVRLLASRASLEHLTGFSLDSEGAYDVRAGPTGRIAIVLPSDVPADESSSFFVSFAFLLDSSCSKATKLGRAQKVDWIDNQTLLFTDFDLKLVEVRDTGGKVLASRRGYINASVAGGDVFLVTSAASRTLNHIEWWDRLLKARKKIVTLPQFLGGGPQPFAAGIAEERETP